MKAVARAVDHGSCPAHLAAFVKAGQVNVTPGREYVVHAVAVFAGMTVLQLVDDLGYPSWKPSWLFSLSDSALAEDWICGLFPDGDPQLIIGPEFIARDLGAYGRMVELDSEQVGRFWQRLEAQHKEAR